MPEYPTSQPGITYADPPCWKTGPWHPEGVIAATIGCEYIRDDGISWERFYKESDDGGTTGWVMRVKLK